MNLMFVPKPLFTSEMSVEGYYFSYQYGNAILEAAKSNPLDGAMISPFVAIMNEVGLEALTQDKIIFLPVTQILMMTDLNSEINVEHSKIALFMDKKVELNDMLLDRVKYFHGLGFRIAFRDFEDLNVLTKFLPYTNYIFFSMSEEQLRMKYKLMRAQCPGIFMVAADIAAKPYFDKIKNVGIHLFDGPFYKVHIPTSTKMNVLTPLKVNYVQLLNIVNQHDFDFSTFTRVIRQDLGLAIQFMRLVNSSSRLNAEIKNINQAAAMLGQREIKKWVATAVSNALCADRPNEIMRLSLIRAKFCENLARYFDMAVLQDNLFLMGLMSILDVILEMPIEDALSMVFVPEQIRKALLYGRGDFSRVLNFILLYEHGDWREISRLALVMDIPISGVYEAYLNAIQWYSHLINMPINDDVT